MGETNQANKLTAIFTVFVNIIRLFTGLTFGLVFLICACYTGFTAVQYTAAFIKAGITAPGFIMKNISIFLIFLALTVLTARFVFYKKLEKLRYSTILLLLLAMVFSGVFFTALDAFHTEDFRWAKYPGYIEEWDTQVVYETVKCDYSATLNFEGYFDFITGGFRENRQVTVKEEKSLTDAYRIEICYKGLPAEMNVYSTEDSENISIWNTDYDYNLSVRDYVYMYTHREDLEYSSPLAVEKIVIYTAYPHLINTEGITN